MSYILDALRKSEQQRQATQPDTVTERILITPPQPKQKPAKWIGALVIGNLLLIAYFVWFFTQKVPTGPQHHEKVANHPDKRLLPPAVTPQGKDIHKPKISPAKQKEPKLPSIAQLLEEKKEANKMADVQRPNNQLPEKKPIAVDKESAIRSGSAVPVWPENPNMIMEKPVALPITKDTPDLNDLPYEIRNTLPNLTINVFSYAQQAEDRFVIIDMVKYRTGQLIKGSVKLKEIRPNSIVLQYGNNTFKVERP
ncbi:general secretion pathway protein GspB [Methyloglobulus sp.]|uniref:general secretion pathway protein GspB n=1 Tax=Methyloglobulus sp. TaxID=2518622 RepID=UPI0039898C8B